MVVRVPCYAKINTFLAVAPPGAGGYHPIRSITHAVSFHDTLVLDDGVDQTTIECNWEGLPPENTLTKALRLLQEVAQVPPLRVTLQKVVPSEAGLGGGSSDAAGLIRGVQPFLPTPILMDQQMDIAYAVGADVPFFLVGGRARAEGFGEKLTPLPDGPSRTVLIVKPEVGCPTGLMYKALDEKSYEWREFPSSDEVYNDFERVAPCECLDLIERLQVLGATSAGLSGSGSAVFGFFVDEAAAASAGDRLDYGSWVCRTLARAESLAVQVSG